MIALPGTGWTPYMFAVARTCISEESVNRKDSIIILDIVTSIYADHKDEMTVLQYVTIPNALDMTAMGKKKVNLMTLYVLWLLVYAGWFYLLFVSHISTRHCLAKS